MAISAGQTTAWVAGNISKMNEVVDVSVISPKTIRVTRKNHTPFVAAIIAVDVVRSELVQQLLDDDPAIEIIANVPTGAVWTGTAIALASDRDVSFGGIADLMRAVSRENVRQYIRPEYEFVERGLGQHTRVANLERKFDRVYQVHRYELPSLTFVMLNEYELTADHVRTARAKYGPFDAVLINNPNGKPTAAAIEVAKDIGAGIFMWREFLGRLNRR
jgi:hypothetical protein